MALILFLFLGNFRGAFIVALTIPFSLLFAAICLSLAKIPANLLSLGALDFGMVVEGAVVMVENIIRYLSRRGMRRSRGKHWRPFAKQRTKCSGRCFTPSASSYGIRADLYPAARGRPPVQAHGLDGVLRSAGFAPFLDAHCARTR